MANEDLIKKAKQISADLKLVTKFENANYRGVPLSGISDVIDELVKALKSRPRAAKKDDEGSA